MSKPFSLEMDTLQLPQHYFVVDLYKLSGIDETQVDGLLGVDFFRGRTVQIDYALGKIRLGVPVPSGAQQTIPLRVLSSGTILLSASIDHNRGEWFRLDTGCASSLQWFQEKSRASTRVVNASVGLTRPGILQTFTTVQTGSVCFEKVPTGLHSKRIFPGEAGLIGNGLFSRYESITIDMSSGRLILGTSRSQNATGM
jgi:hypothetical protein